MEQQLKKQFIYSSQSPEKTRALAQEIVLVCAPFRVFALIGDLGAGKTTLTQALCEALGAQDTVKSPTFSIINEYESQAVMLLTDVGATVPLKAESGIQLLLDEPEQKVAEVWRSHLSAHALSNGPSISFQTVLDTMADHRQQAIALLTLLKQKNDGIVAYLNRLESDSLDLQNRVKGLPTVAPSPTRPSVQSSVNTAQWFTLPSILSTMIPLLLGAKGYVTQGRQTMATDPITAWDHYGDRAERLLTALTTAVHLAQRGRTELLVVVDQSDRALRPHGIKTDWAYTAAHSLSQRLGEITEGLAQGIERDLDQDAIADVFSDVDRQLQQMGDRLQTIVCQDEARRTVAAQQIQQAKTTTLQAQQQYCLQLQAMGLFQAGTPDGILHESERNPSVAITTAYHRWTQLKPCLDQGDTKPKSSKSIRSHLQGRKGLTIHSMNPFPWCDMLYSHV